MRKTIISITKAIRGQKNGCYKKEFFFEEKGKNSIHALPPKVLYVNFIQAGFLTYDLFSSLPSMF
jgi:hypothetical protein